jgi:AraC-like DNA-binding protein
VCSDSPIIETRLGRTGSPPQRGELAADVELLIAGLAPELADICRRLQHESISGIARQLGISRSTLCDRLADDYPTRPLR